MDSIRWHVISEEQELVAVFVDIAGSSKLVENLRGKELSEKLAPWFDNICQIFRAYGAEVKNRPGDCVVAAWTTPKIHFAADRAILAARRCHSSSKSMGIGVHIGIHYGRSQMVQEREPITDLPALFGEASWIAARVQSKDRGSNILATKELKNKLHIPMTWTARSDLEMKELGRQWELFQLDNMASLTFNPEASVLYRWLEAEFESKIGTTDKVQDNCNRALLSMIDVSDPLISSLKSSIWDLLIESLISQENWDELQNTCNLLCQTSEIDNKTKARTNYLLGRFLIEQQKLHEAYEKVSKAMELALHEKLSHLEASCLYTLSNILMQMKDTQSSSLLDKSKNKFQEIISNPISDPLEAALSRLDLSVIYETKDMIDNQPTHIKKQIGCFKEALKYFTTTGDLGHVGITLNGLGCVALKIFRFSDAESYFKRSLQLAFKTNNLNLGRFAHNNLIRAKQNQQKSGTGGMFITHISGGFFESENFSDLLSSDRDDFDLGFLWHKKGKQYMELKNYDRALQCFEQSIKLYRDIAAEVSLSNSLHMVGIIYAKRSDWENAERYFLESLWIDSEDLDIEGVKRSLHDIGLLLINRGDYIAGETLHFITNVLIDWEKDKDKNRILKITEAIDKLPESLSLRIHIEKAVVEFFQRWELFDKFGMMRL